ncbi:MASE1 domain-containing protein [Ramlibacter sp. XY19]|uniref:MASE1 domain-containing protein n=1 Tax=Ramlibacter paludis TaxID=2908000 RepID=UPI0023DC188E|nr:MASE1 domain-containing protein [Ramlibacter paludis]MCG2595458.1 MASE1 domain-containing protein [Ramlibacter paludis]
MAGNQAESLRWQFPAAAAGIAAAYFAGAKLGMALTFSPLPISVLWPPNALLMAALILFPRRWWWGLVAAAFPAHLLVQIEGGVPTAMVLCWFVSNVTEAVIGATLMARLAGPVPMLRSAQSVIGFLCTAIAAPFFSSFLDAAFVRTIGWGDASYATLFEVRFFSNMLATLIFVPPLVACLQAPPGDFPRLARARMPEAVLLAAGLLVSSILAFNINATQPLALSFLYLPMVFLAWAAWRFGPSFASTAFAGVAVLVIVGASHGKGPFLSAALAHSVLPIQLFLITVAVAVLVLAGLVQDQHDVQQRLRNSQELFSTAFRSGPDALAISRREDGQVLEANAGWLRLMGHEEPGRVAPLASHLDAPSRRKLQALAYAGKPVRNTEVSLRDRHGQPRVVLLTSAPVDVAGEACEISMARDITAQRQAEIEAQDQRQQLTHLTRVASLTDFSGTLAHELNQPLTAILSNAQAALRMLSNDPPNIAEVRSILRDIAEADKRAGVLIHHLRLLMKNSDEEFTQIEANHVVQEVLDLAQGEFLLRKVELKTSFCRDLPLLQGDQVQLQQLVLNLVLNACEAMQNSGRPERVLSVDTQHGADGTVQILVSDTGPGIKPELLGRVFEPFYSTKANGLGLGLSICRKIAAHHGGTLSVQNNHGGGATFRCALPPVRQAARAPGAAQRLAGARSTTASS